MFDGLFSYRYNMRLKSPCEVASDMTQASPNAFKNQLQAVYAYNISQRPGLVGKWHYMKPTARQSTAGWRTPWAVF